MPTRIPRGVKYPRPTAYGKSARPWRSFSLGPKLYQGALIAGYTDAGGTDNPTSDASKLAAYDSYVANSGGIAPALLHQGYSWKKSDGTYNAFPLADVTRFRAKGAIPIVSFQPAQSGAGNSQAAFSYDAIVRGDHDAFLTQWATAAANWGHPFILRLGHEFNAGAYFPWLQGQTYNKTANGATKSYADMWRHVVDVMRPIAPNIRWFWCTNTKDSNYPLNATNWPGRAYVDYAGFDTYFGRQQYFDAYEDVIACWAATYDEVAAVCEGRLMIVGETGVEEYATNPNEKQDWFKQLWSALWRSRFPLIRAVVYYNRMHDPAESVKGNWLVSTSANAIAGYQTLANATQKWETNNFANFDGTDVLGGSDTGGFMYSMNFSSNLNSQYIVLI